MITEELFRSDSYLRECEATVVAVNARGGIVLDRSVFYPTGGGQPGDLGVLALRDGREIRIVAALKGDGEENVVHVPEEGALVPKPGDTLTARIDWERRFKHPEFGLASLRTLVRHISDHDLAHLRQMLEQG